MSTVPGRTSPTSASQRRDGRHAELRGTARERLLNAALAELRERGYEGSSLEAIARRAGLTRGAVYWNFHSKLELFVALLEQRVDGPARELMRLTETAPPETLTAGAVSHGLGRLVREQRDLIMLLFEYWALAVRDPNLRPSFNERQKLLRNALARALESRHAHTGVPLVYPAERLATAILALANGLAMTALAEPEAVSEQLLGEVLDLLYDGLAARASGAGSGRSRSTSSRAGRPSNSGRASDR
ncbi:MAG: TetR family transcriptional regulator [Actinobacteria bacterium]|nr:MAG: TetR family transcriptional regulator [Actinomycetota bacterium]